MSQRIIPLSELDETESLHLDALAAEEGLERTDFTVWRTDDGLALTELDPPPFSREGVTHDLTNGLDLA